MVVSVMLCVRFFCQSMFEIYGFLINGNRLGHIRVSLYTIFTNLVSIMTTLVGLSKPHATSFILFSREESLVVSGGMVLAG
jgi:hypothetical protein